MVRTKVITKTNKKKSTGKAEYNARIMKLINDLGPQPKVVANKMPCVRVIYEKKATRQKYKNIAANIKKGIVGKSVHKWVLIKR